MGNCCGKEGRDRALLINTEDGSTHYADWETLNPWKTPLHALGVEFAHDNTFRAGPLVSFGVVKSAPGLKPFEHKQKTSTFKALQSSSLCDQDRRKPADIHTQPPANGGRSDDP